MTGTVYRKTNAILWHKTKRRRNRILVKLFEVFIEDCKLSWKADFFLTWTTILTLNSFGDPCPSFSQKIKLTMEKILSDSRLLTPTLLRFEHKSTFFFYCFYSSIISLIIVPQTEKVGVHLWDKCFSWICVTNQWRSHKEKLRKNHFT